VKPRKTLFWGIIFILRNQKQMVNTDILILFFFAGKRRYITHRGLQEGLSQEPDEHIQVLHLAKP
jgi:hypothetical protein